MDSGRSAPPEGEAGMDRLPRRPLAERVADKIVESIADGALRPGARIVESDIVHRLGVSRAPIREAMKMLQSQGLIEISQGRRPRILPASPATVVESLGTLVTRSDISLRQLTEVRRPLEIEIAGLAAERAGEQDLQDMQDAVNALRDAAGFQMQIAADIRFHEALANASGNPLFGIVLDVFAQQLHESRRQTLKQSGKAMALSYHRRILSAVKKRDAAKARQLMARHMQQTREDIAKARS